MADPTPTDLPMPTTGGAWIRNADGTLSRDLNEHPEAAATAPAPQAETHQE